MCRSTVPDAAQPHAYPRDWRRRSADVGGLHLALAGAAIDDGDEFGAQGQGWMGGEPGAVETIYAELLSDMYTETVNSVNDHSLQAPPPTTSDSVRARLIWSLDRWNFEPHRLPEDEVLACTLLLFEALFRIDGMQQAIPLSMLQISAFIHHLRRIYRYENTYHNFEHALDVLQATQSYLKSAGIVPPPTFLFQPPDRRWAPAKVFNSGSLIATLGLRELFVLYVAAIGHDVGHPGFTNVFMKNAQAPLSLLFNHGSALEHMHCQLLLRVMRFHGFGVLLDDPHHGAHLRQVLQKSVLATDMGVHEDFMARLRRVVDGEMLPLCSRQILLCQAILKNADISNPTRPFLVSKHWASALLQEWTAQAHLEEEYHLAQTVMSSSDPIKEADSQIFFIQKFARPLLELTQKAVPEMRMYMVHCKANLETWLKRRKELVEARERELLDGTKAAAASASANGVTRRSARRASESGSSTSEDATASTLSSSSSSSNLSAAQSASPPSVPPPISPRFPCAYHTAFPLTLPPPPTPPLSSFLSSVGSGGGGGPLSFSSSSSSADRDLEPDSPTTEDGSVMSAGVLSPVSETGSAHSANSHAHRPYLAVPSSSSSSHAAIRAASKVGSLRKKSQTGLAEMWAGFGFGGAGGVGAQEKGKGKGGTGGKVVRKASRNSWCAPSEAGGGGGGGGLVGMFVGSGSGSVLSSGSGVPVNESTIPISISIPNPPPTSAPPLTASNLNGHAHPPTSLPPLALGMMGRGRGIALEVAP